MTTNMITTHNQEPTTMPTNPVPVLLTIDQAVERSTLSKSTLRALIAAGHLEARRFGRAVRVLTADLDRLLMQGTGSVPLQPKGQA